MGRASADFTCNIKDMRNNNLTYSFTGAYNNNTAVAEKTYTRNGQTTVQPTDRSPAWALSANTAEQIVALWSLVDRGWQIAVFANVGTAALYHDGNLVGSGNCFHEEGTMLTVAELPVDQIATTLNRSSAVNPSTVKHQTISPPVVITPTQQSHDAVPIIVGDSRAYVSVMMGEHGVTMLIDSGATESLVVGPIASSLIASGAATETESSKASIADGTVIEHRNIIVKTLAIGSHTLHDVRMGVIENNENTENLLGFDILNRMGKFTIDTINAQLVFG
jgi:predicted aspartyl protease